MSEDTDCTENPYCETHGFNRNASHSEHRYVCDCEGWSPNENLVDTIDAVVRQLREAQDAFDWDCQSYEDKCRELEAENAELRKAIQFEQTLRKEYHNEETERLRGALAAVARQALAVNKTVNDQPEE
jgi:hypothetical protein